MPKAIYVVKSETLLCVWTWKIKYIKTFLKQRLYSRLCRHRELLGQMLTADCNAGHNGDNYNDNNAILLSNHLLLWL